MQNYNTEERGNNLPWSRFNRIRAQELEITELSDNNYYIVVFQIIIDLNKEFQT